MVSGHSAWRLPFQSEWWSVWSWRVPLCYHTSILPLSSQQAPPKTPWWVQQGEDQFTTTNICQKNFFFPLLNFQLCTEAGLSVNLLFSVYLKRSSNFPWPYKTSLCYKKYYKFRNSSASLLVQKQITNCQNDSFSTSGFCAPLTPFNWVLKPEGQK